MSSNGECGSEDGECSHSPKEIIEIMDSGSFTMDRTSDALDVEVVIESQEDSTQSNNSGKDWRRSVTSLVMTTDDVEENKNEKKVEVKRRAMCFNCDGDHNLNQCTERRDFERIRLNRQSFQDRQNARNDTRYHGAAPTEDANPQYKPGRVSDNLMRALGLGPNDIPEYIYRMRKMGFERGYPPGYLKKAIVTKSGNDLLQFHTDHPDLKNSEEENDAQKKPPVLSLDADKIIYYFGFNKTYRALQDKERFRVPPFEEFVEFLENYSKKRMIADWEAKQKEDRRIGRKRHAQFDSSSKQKISKIDDEVVIVEEPSESSQSSQDDADVAFDSTSTQSVNHFIQSNVALASEHRF